MIANQSEFPLNLRVSLEQCNDCIEIVPLIYGNQLHWKAYYSINCGCMWLATSSRWWRIPVLHMTQSGHFQSDSAFHMQNTSEKRCLIIGTLSFVDILHTDMFLSHSLLPASLFFSIYSNSFSIFIDHSWICYEFQMLNNFYASSSLLNMTHSNMLW